MKKLIQVLMFCCAIVLNDKVVAQDVEKHYFDFVAGPYLFIDHIPYDAVMMKGARLGHYFKERIHGNLEYVVGQQHDDQHTLGMTHNANVQFNYDVVAGDGKFNLYLYAGGGFMEFKSFSKDVYGIQYDIGAGTELKLHEQVKGIIEARYFNLGMMDLGGKHEIAVFWGLRFKF